jgi:CRP-like cAMP-binding protein
MYTTTEKILFLKGVSLFAEVPGEDLVALARSAEVVHAAAGKPVVREGEIGDALYVLLTGAARVERAGRELARLARGECFGEMAVLDREPRSATVIATEASQMLRIAQDDFYEILADHAEIAEGILRVLTHRLRKAAPGA